MIDKRYSLHVACFALAVLSVFLIAAPCLFAASITNEGKATAKVNMRSAQGIVGGGSIKPGQSLHLKSDLLWIEHVPEGSLSPVQLTIVENDGRIGSIHTFGGRYTFQNAAGTEPAVKKEKKTQGVLMPGYAENRSNLAMLLSLIDAKKQQSYTLLMPGQKGVIPKETVEVIADRNGWSSGDVQITLFIVMPDGKEHTIKTSHAVVQINPDLN